MAKEFQASAQASPCGHRSCGCRIIIDNNALKELLTILFDQEAN
jgi:hypothetical protein